MCLGMPLFVPARVLGCRRHAVFGVLVLCVSFGACASSRADEASAARLVHPTDARFELLGTWQRDETNVLTVFVGSQIRFALRGRASLHLRAGAPGSARVRVTKNGAIVWDRRIATGSVLIDGGDASAAFSVIYVASGAGYFEPVAPKPESYLHFDGCELEPGAELCAAQLPTMAQSIAFFGDSITSGTCIYRGDGEWDAFSDVTLTYAFQLAETLRMQYYLKSVPGGTTTTFVPFLEANAALLKSESPALCFINFGANERASTGDTYRWRMRRLVQSVFMAYPGTHVVLLNFMRMTPNRLPELETVAASFPAGAVSVFDCRPFLVNYADKDVHPDEESHWRLCKALVSLVRSSTRLLVSPERVFYRACEKSATHD